MTATTQHPVFVYGTLRTGQYNHRLFGPGSIAAIEPATLADADMYGAGRGYPYVTDGSGVVVGELVWLSTDTYEDMLQRLDRLEGYRGPGDRNHYDRVERLVATPARDGGGSAVTAWVYLAARTDGLGGPIPSGDWVASQMQRPEAA